MELVRGIPITKYCDENHLAPKERLELFIKVCQAIQHAHQKGVIHRDIKPSNILVTVNDGAPTPKAIDFGIAKATQGRLTDATVFTAFEQFIGTPVYMSPEQAEMNSLDIDTRSDIYSLGVLLYELLTGRPPFDPKAFAKAGVDEIRHQIREAEPQKPSRRLHTLDDIERTTIARLRNTAPAQLSLLLRGDLDWIVMRCLEKDRTRRYDTANGLAMDIQRHLRHEPVIARPPSSAYLLQKLIRRHRFGFAATAAIVLVLVAGAIISTWLAIRATRAEHDQSHLRDIAQRARTNESTLREQANAEALSARQKAYASDMNLTQQALALGNHGRAVELLYRQRPRAAQRDLRGWEWRYLWQFCQGDQQFILCQNEIPILWHAVSPDGKWLAFPDGANGVSLWNLSTQQERHLEAGRGAAFVAFSSRDSLLAMVVPGNRLLLWNVVLHQLVSEIPLGAGQQTVVFSADGEYLLTTGTGENNRIALWQVAGPRKLAEHDAPANSASVGRAFAATSDLTLAAHQTLDGKGVRVIDIAAGAERWTAKAVNDSDSSGIFSIAFSPDGKCLATGSGFGGSDIRLFDVGTGEEIGRLEGHRAFVSALLFLPDGKTLASASGDMTLRLWDWRSQRLLKILRGHTKEPKPLALLADNTTIVSSGKDGMVCFWDTTTAALPDPFVTLRKRVEAWCFTPDSKSVLTVDALGIVERWSGAGFQQRSTVLEVGKIDRPLSFQFARDCPLLAVGSATGIVRVWDWERRTLSRELQIDSGPISPVAFLGSGQKLIVSEGDKIDQFLSGPNLREWDVITGKETRSWPALGNNKRYYCFFSPDERLCLMLGSNGVASLRDLVTNRETNPKFSVGQPRTSSFSPDGKSIVEGNVRGFARLWDATTFREVATLSGFMFGVYSAVFSPDGRRIVTGSGGVEAIRVWDTESHEQLLTLEHGAWRFTATAFSPDGNTLGSTPSSGELSLWRAPSWAEIDAVEKRFAPQPARP